MSEYLSPVRGERLTFVQYGDFRETTERFLRGESETYQAQRHSVEFVWDLQPRMDDVSVVVLGTEQRFDERTANGIRVVGTGPDPYSIADASWFALLDDLAPTRLVVRTPHPPTIRWGQDRGCRMLATLADSVTGSGLRQWVRRRRMRRLLSGSRLEWIANHGRGAAAQLVDLGIDPARVVPWDWPATSTPDDVAPRLIEPGRPARLFFAGMLSAAKGVDDLLRAVAQIVASGRPVSLTLAGDGERERLEQLGKNLGVSDSLVFLGRIPNTEVRRAMGTADLVVVPSRHDYPEGLPLTIYEALTARTPLILSDHPMFTAALRDQEASLFFPGGSVKALAVRIEQVLTEPGLHARLAHGTLAAWQRLQLPVEWTELVGRWLADRPEDRAWIASHSVAASRT